MAEPTRTPAGKESHRVPAWSWPYIFGVFMLGYPVLFFDNRSLRTEIREAKNETVALQREELQRKEKDAAAIRRQNEFLTRLLYTSENMRRFLYTDSIALANRSAALEQLGAGSTEGQREERPN